MSIVHFNAKTGIGSGSEFGLASCAFLSNSLQYFVRKRVHETVQNLFTPQSFFDPVPCCFVWVANHECKTL